MKGVILAGGLGTRLSPITNITNKHLLPVWHKPMIYYPLEYLAKAGIKDVLLVTGGSYAGRFIDLLKDGKEFGLNSLEYAYQEGEGGIADALKLAKHFVGDSKFCVVLGDNIYYSAPSYAVSDFERSDVEAAIFVQSTTEANKAKDFGVVFTPNKDSDLPLLVEKPTTTEFNARIASGSSACIVTGTYMYTPSVFEICDRIKPSSRGELEISDVNSHFLSSGKIKKYYVNSWWIDAGTFKNLATAADLVSNTGANHTFHEIAE